MTAKKRATYIDGQYVVTDTGTDDEWYTVDGEDWVDQHGRAIPAPTAQIEYLAGPLCGE